MARVLALLRSWLRAESRDRLPNADGYVRELEMLGAEAVAAVRDANQWATYEPLIATVGLAEAFLRLCGARLASRWLGSSRPMLEESAQTWLLGNWQRCWGELSDGLKRWLVDYYSQHAGQSEQRWSGSRELLVLLGRALQSQPKADGS